MKKAITALLAALPLIIAPASAAAHKHGSAVSPGVVGVVGKITAVDTAHGDFTADVSIVSAPGAGRGSGEGDGDGQGGGEGYVDPLNPGWPGSGQGYEDPLGPGHPYGGPGDRHGPASDSSTTPVTITPGSGTKIVLGGRFATLANLAAGDSFSATFRGSPSDSLSAITSNPPLLIVAKAAPKRTLYAFVGTVTSTDTNAGTVTVDVVRTLPSSLAPAGSSASFTVDSSTLILGAGSGSSLLGDWLSDVQRGDIVAGGVEAAKGLSLGQLSALPLRLMLDLPVGTLGSSHRSSSAMAKAKVKARAGALKRALSLLNTHGKIKVVQKVTKPVSHKRSSHHRSTRKHASPHKSSRHR